MRRILSSVLVSSLLAMLAVAQSSRSVLVENSMRKASGHDRSARRDLRVYVITVDSQFGALNLRTGEFVPIPVSPGLADQGIGQGLVQGLGRSLLSLSFSGYLDKIDPFTGVTSQIGTGTGLADCSLLGSYAPNCAGFIGQLGERLYATDFAQNLYSISPITGKAKLIGPTGIPPIDFAPFSDNPDGSVNVFGESLFSAHGKLYAFFVTVAINFETGTNTPQISGAIYEINPRTGKTAPPIPTNSGLSHIASVNDTTYGFDAWTEQVVTVDLATGETTPVRGAVVHGPGCEAGPPACVVAGATAVNPVPDARR
jgi:hypothetical protein